jgi:hypothetical protein
MRWESCQRICYLREPSRRIHPRWLTHMSGISKLGHMCGASREDVDASAHVRVEHRPFPRGASDRVPTTCGCSGVGLEERGTLWDRQLLMGSDFGQGKVERIGEVEYSHLTLTEHDKTKTGAIPRLYLPPSRLSLIHPSRLAYMCRLLWMRISDLSCFSQPISVREWSVWRLFSPVSLRQLLAINRILYGSPVLSSPSLLVVACCIKYSVRA